VSLSLSSLRLVMTMSRLALLPDYEMLCFWPELMHRGMQVCGGNAELSMGGFDPWAALAEIFQFLEGWVGFCPL